MKLTKPVILTPNKAQNINRTIFILLRFKILQYDQSRVPQALIVGSPSVLSVLAILDCSLLFLISSFISSSVTYSLATTNREELTWLSLLRVLASSFKVCKI